MMYEDVKPTEKRFTGTVFVMKWLNQFEAEA